jgi:hypothetical protein
MNRFGSSKNLLLFKQNLCQQKGIECPDREHDKESFFSGALKKQGRTQDFHYLIML